MSSYVVNGPLSCYKIITVLSQALLEPYLLHATYYSYNIIAINIVITVFHLSGTISENNPSPGRYSEQNKTP